MTIERVNPSGAWKVYALVTNGHDSWLETRTYYGYNKRHSLAQYKQTILSMGWTLVP